MGHVEGLAELLMLDCHKAKRKKQAIRTLPDGRQRCRTEAGWQAKRKEVFERERGLCERCMAFAPLHNTETAFAGHAHHIKGRKVGDDREHMLEWLCGRCHAETHIPLKVVPKKSKEVA